MDTEDGSVFIKNLAYYVRTHEKALANALQLQTRTTRQSAPSGAGTPPSGTATPSANSAQQSSSTTGVFASALPYLGFAPQTIKPAKLYLTPNQLYYLLSRFEDLGVSIGSMNVRLENIHADHTPSNYVSFLVQAQQPKGRSADQDSIHSVSSVRSVMSSVSSMWSSFSLSNSSAKIEKRKAAEMEDLRYLYSAFTKIPCLKLALDHRVPRIADYEEFPFDTAVPLHAFKNASTLEIVDLDFRTIYGWDRLAEQLRSLTVKRACVDDLFDLLVNVVLDDADGRRKRSAKTSPSSVFPHPIPKSITAENPDISRSSSLPDSPTVESRTSSSSRPLSADMSLVNVGVQRPNMGPRLHSISPPRPSSARRGSAYNSGRPLGKVRQSSGSSTTSIPSYSTRTSSSNLSMFDRQASKWRLLRHLSLADNALTSISRQSLTPLTSTLQSLDLSSNLFSEIPDSLAALVSLRALNLANCMIESLHSLARSPLPAITVLNLRGNRIASLAGIEKLLSLERLDLRENKLRDPIELARLTSMPNFRDLYVNRNPFTKTHTNYRVTVFNLFRDAPGYQDDIAIDGTGPSYGERRQLNDRAPELVGGPVIRWPVEDEPKSEQPEPKTVPHINEGIDETGRSTLGPVLDDTTVKNQRRRKGPKRRIVDIAQAEVSRKPNLTVSTHEGVQVAAGQRHALNSQSDHASPPLSPIASSPDTQYTTGERQWPPDKDQSQQTRSGEQYRKRVESLKHMHGSGWLSALGDEAWQDSNGVQSPQAYTEKEFTASAAISPPLHTTVASSNRRLG